MWLMEKEAPSELRDIAFEQLAKLGLGDYQEVETGRNAETEVRKENKRERNEQIKRKTHN